MHLLGEGQTVLDEVLEEILDFIGDHILVSHNAEFDLGFLNAALRRRGRKLLSNPTIDTLTLVALPLSLSHEAINLVF